MKKFKIPYDSICKALVKFWAKVHKQKIIKALPTLISQMKGTCPPKMKNEDFKELVNKWEMETRYIRIYQEENEKIYRTQILLLERYLQNKQLTWDFFFIEE